jgi:predicted ArsR family transcriptional regulator
MTAVPVGDVDDDRVRTILDEEGTVRLSELAEELGTNRPTLYNTIMTLVEDGDAAVFPIGDVVQVRSE